MARFVADVCNELDLSAIYAEYERNDGRGLSAYHPLLLTRLLLCGYSIGLTTSRAIEKAAYDSVAFRYLAADQHPDHDTIASFRQEHLWALAGLFVQAMTPTYQLGLFSTRNQRRPEGQLPLGAVHLVAQNFLCMKCEVVMKTLYFRAVSFGLLVGLLTLYPCVIAAQDSTAEPSTATSVPAFGGCPAPANAGVQVCQPFNFDNSTTIASPFQLIASGTGANGPVRQMEVWVDFVKVKQASGNLFDAPLNLSSGTHRLVVVERDTTGATMKSAPIAVSIEGSTEGQPCAPAGSPGVNLCDPTIGSCHTAAWVTIIASGTGASGSVHRMELWSNGVKLANFPGDAINTNLFLADFTTVTIVEVDSAGAFIKSPRITLQSC